MIYILLNSLSTPLDKWRRKIECSETVIKPMSGFSQKNYRGAYWWQRAEDDGEYQS